MPVIKIVWPWQENRYIDQCSRIENPEIDPHNYSNLIFDKGTKPFSEVRTVFSINVAGAIIHPKTKI